MTRRGYPAKPPGKAARAFWDQAQSLSAPMLKYCPDCGKLEPRYMKAHEHYRREGETVITYRVELKDAARPMVAQPRDTAPAGDPDDLFDLIVGR